MGIRNRFKEARMSPHVYRLLMAEKLSQLRRSYAYIATRGNRQSPPPRTRIWSDQHVRARRCFATPRRSQLGPPADMPTGLARSRGRRAAGPSATCESRPIAAKPTRKPSGAGPSITPSARRNTFFCRAASSSARCSVQAPTGPSAPRGTTWERTRALHGRDGDGSRREADRALTTHQRPSRP